MVAALEDFVTQTTAQVGFALEEGAGELEMWKKKKKKHVRSFKKQNDRKLILNITCALRVLHLLYKEPECSKDVPKRGG